MLGLLEGIDEYNNAGALLGLEGLDNDELLGALRQMNPLQRQKTINKLTAPPVASKGSRAEMEKHFAELPDHIREGLLKGELRLADTVIYSIKPVLGLTTKFFETQDDMEKGLRSVSNAKLQRGQALLVSGIIMLAGVSADATKAKVIGTAYDKIETFPAIANGEFSLKANKKQIVPDTSNNVFKTSNMNMVPIGYYKLANPRIIPDDVQIEFTMELGSMEAIAANTHVFVGLHGTITTP
ncbi:MAG TPA: hypothetical protein VD905_19630 [Flavobacteriales bacterium]|nr:hypothetical protein [Flavobacteriales bacterium]